MPIIPWRPFGDIERWFEGMEPEEWFERPRWGRMWPAVRTPRMDIYEEGKNVIVKVELPGIDPKNIDVEVKDNILKVEAKTEEKKEEKGKGYYRKEISAGYLKRAVPLPAEVIGEKADANYQEGILKVVIPKKQVKKTEKKGKKIKVKK
jgi:HSP20 family protein